MVELYAREGQTLDEHIAVIRAIVAWRKANDTRKSYLSGLRLLRKLQAEKRNGTRG